MSEKVEKKKRKLDVNQRKGIIGGSSMGACIGLSTYKSPYEVYEEFMGIQHEVTPEKAEIFEMGHQLEGFIAKQAERIFGIKLRRVNFALVHPKYEWLVCHPDREVVGKVNGKKIGVEIKSSSTYDNARWGDPDTDQIPMDYLCQCHDYMMCGDYDEVWLFRFSNNRLTRYIITKDEELETVILTKVVKFVDDVKSGWVPPFSDVKQVTAKFCQETGGSVVADEKIENLVDELNSARLAKKNAEERIDAIKIQVIDFMKDKKYLFSRTGEKLCSYYQSKRTQIDIKRLQAEKPELCAQYSKESTSMVLR